jgi:Domain of unknown function (DUF4382)
MKTLSFVVFLFLSLLFTNCSIDDGFKGKLILSITDSPLDADDVKGVNLVLTNIEIKRKEEWKSLKTFDQPQGVNLLAFTDGKSFPVVDQLVDPGTYSEIRFSLNVSTGSALIKNPLCNIEFTDGSTQVLLLPAEAAKEFIITREISIKPNQTLDLTLDVDVRKSIVKNGQNQYIFTPSVRTLITFETGSITGKVLNVLESDRVIVFAYKAGQYNSGETSLTDGIRFKNSITASKVKKGKFTTAFLEAGTYDLVFTKQTKTGEFINVVGFERNISIQAKDQIQLEVDINKLTGS